ncbi:Proline-rich protein [Myxococcus hansupus]|uniref:Proline-rich protein n=1 Tax=Pseudomyxococcus hansupus TaxID=1297742 RepID=A0A0H4X856_9BACT|nr:DUF6600 domain-containing protein [Myxococcus hansupus]AKQ64012.1 Proline-rich protein [Myxococcus hansupus]
MRGRFFVVVVMSLFAARAGAQSLAPPEYSQPPPVEYSVQEPVTSPTLSDFQQALDPYGEWVQTPDYGLVWVPSDTPQGWRPYTDGRWAYTDQGWTFVSNASWGWAPFHYGRWAVVQPYGWTWIPGYDWAPAWVTWRYGGDYIAWAPLGPLSVGIDYYSEPTMWNAVLAPDFLDPLAPSVFIPSVQLNLVLNRTYFAGVPRRGVYFSPPPQRVAQLTGRPVTRVPVASVVPRNPWSGGHLGQPARPPPAATPRPYGGSGTPRPGHPNEVVPAPAHPAARPPGSTPARPAAPAPMAPREARPATPAPVVPRESQPARPAAPAPVVPREAPPERTVIPPPMAPREAPPERSVAPPPREPLEPAPMPETSRPERSVAPPPREPLEPAPMPETSRPARPSEPPPAPHPEPMHPEHMPAPSPHPHR